MGKFFNAEVKKENTVNKKLLMYILIGVGVAIAIALIVILIVTTNKNKPVLKSDGLSIGIGDEYPDAKDFFKNVNESLEIKADYSKCDNTKVGDCKVTLSGDIKNMTTTLHIKDYTPPEVLAKEKVNIAVGETYTPETFIESCTDNVSATCTIKFYEKSKDDDGNIIDYSKYTEEGNYKIKIYAVDEAGNSSDTIEVELIIGAGATACAYGSMEYDTTKYSYPLTVETTTDGCPVDKKLYNESIMKEKADKAYNNDYEKLKTDMTDILKKEYPMGANINVCPQYFPIFNTANKGLVGYSIYVKVFINTDRAIDCNEQGMEEFIALSYYIKNDGTRIYDKNNYQI